MSESILHSDPIKKKVYRSKVGFRDALGESSTLYMGGMLDAKVRDIIGSYGAASVNYLSNGGPAFGVLLMKVNASYYGGIVFGYYDERLTQFAYNAGNYRVIIYE